MTSESFHKQPSSPRRLAKTAAGGALATSVAPKRLLTAAEFQGLSDVPPEAEWFANLSNPRTRRAYQGDIREFMTFVGIAGAGEFRLITRAHALAWRKELELIAKVGEGATFTG